MFIDDLRVYVPVETYLSSAGMLYCLNRTTGALIWSIVPGAYLWSLESNNDGFVYFGFGSSRLQCVDSSSGNVIWSMSDLPVAGEALSFTLHRGVLVVAVFAGLVGLDPGSGAAVWVTPLQVRFGFAKDDGGFLFIGLQHGVAAIDVTNGAVVWSYLNPGGSEDITYLMPQLARGRVMTQSFSEGFFAVNASNGRLLWSGMGGGGAEHFNPLYSATTPVTLVACGFGAGTGTMIGMSVFTGATVWNETQASCSYLAPDDADGVVFTASENSLLGIDANTGKIVVNKTIMDFCQGCVMTLQVRRGVVFYASTSSIDSFQCTLYAVPL